MKFKAVLGSVMTAAMLSSATFAYAATPLPAGKPAGVQKATLLGVDAGWIIVGVMVALVVVAASGSLSEEHSANSTGSPYVNPSH